MAEETWGAYLARLDREATAGLKEALRYYLGPTGIPDKLNVLAPVAASMLPGVGEGMDMQDAANASSRLWAEPSLPNALALVPPTVALAVPGISNRLAQGLTDVGGDIAATARRFPGDEFGGVGPKGTPAQQIAELLASGRGDEVTDDLMAQADPQEMWRLYESGATGVDMPMDEASRLARARGMYEDAARWAQKEEFAAHVGLRTDTKPDGWTRPSRVWKDGKITRKRLPGVSSTEIKPGADNTNAFDAHGLGNGVTGWMDDYVGGMGSKRDYLSLIYGDRAYFGQDRLEKVITDAKSALTRDRTKARFDPRLAHLSNLSAATVPFMFGGLNALAGYDEQQ